MRRVKRAVLTSSTRAALATRQESADSKRLAGNLNIDAEWKSARQTKPLKTVVGVLKVMAGKRERCMYCCDSHGTDVEHFWPKAGYPCRMFDWLNLLLCCSECGRFKGVYFPVENATPKLVDPTAEDPWAFLDFDAATGVIVARFDLATGAESPKGVATVKCLQLDRREALNDGYLKTCRRLTVVVTSALAQGCPDAGALIAALDEADDHGLLGWCFTGTGQNAVPFETLRVSYPVVWTACVQALG